MIKILIKYEGNEFDSLEVKGHANSAPHGQDLVCAGVSAILIGGLNNLDNVKSFDIKIEEGYTADLVILSGDFKVKMVFIDGKRCK